MCNTSGQPITYTAGTPEDVSGLRQQIISLLSGGIGRGATPYQGPIAPQANPLMLGAANMLNQMMGYGQYQQPGYMMNPFGSMSGGSGGDTGLNSGGQRLAPGEVPMRDIPFPKKGLGSSKRLNPNEVPAGDLSGGTTKKKKK